MATNARSTNRCRLESNAVQWSLMQLLLAEYSAEGGHTTHHFLPACMAINKWTLKFAMTLQRYFEVKTYIANNSYQHGWRTDALITVHSTRLHIYYSLPCRRTNFK